MSFMYFFTLYRVPGMSAHEKAKLFDCIDIRVKYRTTDESNSTDITMLYDTIRELWADKGVSWLHADVVV